MAQQDVRYYLNGLYVNLSSKEKFLVLQQMVIDLRNLALKLNYSGRSQLSAIIPRKGVIEIDKQLEKSRKILTAAVSKNHMQISSQRYKRYIKA
jgi:DNA polymerase III sliding clamp (beta) subunit (PCNA family)